MSEKNQQRAAEIWATFNDSEKHGARFAMFPAGKMQPAAAPGFNQHEIVCALMDLAKAGK